MSRKGRAAIQRATRDDGLPCVVVDYEDTDRVVGAAGPPDFIAEVESKAVNGVIRVGKMETDHTVIVDRILSQMGLVDGR